MSAKRVATNKKVLRQIMWAEAETQHLVHVSEVILKLMKPLGAKATIVLAPKGYNCFHLKTSVIRVNPEKHLLNGIIFIPKEELEQVTVTHGAKVVDGDKTTYYYWNGSRLLDKVCTAETTAVGLVFNDPKKAK